MKLRCRLSNRRMIEYLDETMSASARKRFDLHLASCEDCRDKLAEQKNWLAQRAALLADQKENGLLPDDLPAKIMAAVGKATTTEQTEFRSKPSLRRVWLVPVGVVAALALFVAIWQILPFLTKQFPVHPQKSIRDFASPLEPAYSVLAPSYAVENTYNANGYGSWYLFLPEKGDQIALNNTSGESEICYLTVLNLAADARAAVLENDLNTAVILFPVSPDSVTELSDRAESVLKACSTPFQIEIIKSADIQRHLNSMDPVLYGMMFNVPPADSDWILIWIGK